MKVLIAVFAAIAVAHAGPGITVKFGVGPAADRGNTFYINIPTTIDDVIEAGWTETTRPEGPLQNLVMYCPPHKNLCPLFDDTEFIAGLQVALRVDELTNYPFDFVKHGFIKWETEIDNLLVSFWTQSQFFVNEETYLKSKEERILTRDSDRILQEDKVWVTGAGTNEGRELYEILTSEQQILDQGIFTTQSCLNGMGQHYYYKMTPTTNCTAKSILPFFAMTHCGQLSATAFMVYGKLSTYRWFENPSSEFVKIIVPNGPACLANGAATYGAITLHIYYITNPWDITCDTAACITVFYFSLR